MSRVQAVVDHITKQALTEAALELFDEHGYRGTSIRKIAARAGCSAGGFYEHFRSKQAILREIIDATYAAASAEVEAAVALAGDDPASRLEAAVWAQCDFQMRFQRACRVAHAELPNLESDDRERLLAKRVRLAQINYEIVSEGAASGVFDVTEPEATTRSLTTICGAIGSWYDPGGNQVPRQIAQAHCELAARLAGVGVHAAPRARAVAALRERRSA
jgi:AcrR family transcriptional regulator